ncbi:sigma-54 interaction domain-containing protein [Rheinheimera pacifica]|uniref:DNA-binding transcriptional response regulator, NtrC family, contains REC, AAA-type ATPase, and a Fis-type DNA-binding domains n=1 Tax=Rheinheimera pacifica TaxID=173990 RepID=A0A1H6JWN5_9GAMM|nr:sigma-54 dependent transcriptional regulator [Rheinheimera pacifica]SEH66821.1 DNA-binding transcriptional response regulator, NtrC family, contains REC, AAA-type ATPase, and a Fis-type DNA-binding domains [Rheinheimera pacifica]
MTQPRLFLHVQDSGLATQLLQSPAVRRFVVVRSSDSAPWSEQLQQQPCELAFIQADKHSQADYQRLLNSKLLAEIDFIVVSDGCPDPALDQLMRSGAGYHFRQPLDIACILDILQDFYEQLSTSRQQAKTSVSALDQFGLLVGSSRSMLKLYRTLRKVAVTEANVLIAGESGAGKELVANTLHLASYRAEQPFVAINCGALSPELVDSELFGHTKGAFTGALREHQGVFSQAEGGTLFLDEVTEMPLDQQVKLLRVLESGEYRPVGSDKVCQANVRIVAATNRDPQQAIAEGVLREDLYFRLAQFPVHVPPLRDRGDDICGLAQHFLAYRNAKEQQQKQLAAETLQLIAQHSWPGNVRELKHAVERAYILADKLILPEHLLLETPADDSDEQCLTEVPCGVSLEELEKAAILNTLEQNAGNKTDTAQQLGISVKTLYNKLEKYQQTEQ